MEDNMKFLLRYTKMCLDLHHFLFWFFFLVGCTVFLNNDSSLCFRSLSELRTSQNTKITKHVVTLKNIFKKDNLKLLLRYTKICCTVFLVVLIYFFLIVTLPRYANLVFPQQGYQQGPHVRSGRSGRLGLDQLLRRRRQPDPLRRVQAVR